jgi:hypothetical protein
VAPTGAIARDAIEGFCVLGELSLDGSIATVAGTLPAAIGANALGKGLICPASCGAEAAWAAADMTILAPQDLLQLINHFKGLQTLRRPRPRRRGQGCPHPCRRGVELSRRDVAPGPSRRLNPRFSATKPFPNILCLVIAAKAGTNTAHNKPSGVR